MEKEYKIAIIGLGYVGLPLALAFSEHFQVVGFDISSERVKELKNKIDSNADIDVDLNSNLVFTNDESCLTSSNIYIVTVPTPVNKENIPDLSFLRSASELIADYLKKDDIVIYESTVYPGVTEEFCVPILSEKSGLNYNDDFYCGYSPERISPGAEQYTLQNVVKVTSGSTPVIADVVNSLYSKIIKAGTYKAESIKVAEAAKVIENTQRDVNIALMNELAMMFDKMNVNTSKVLEAAKTKWNFLDFKPGLVGGHCIGVDPYYLTYKSEKSGYNPTLLHSSRKINNSVAKFITNKTSQLLNEVNIETEGASILILGYTFKENCADTRNTKVKDILELLKGRGCNVNVYDPYLENKGCIFINNPLERGEKYDAIIVAVAHNVFVKYTTADFQQLSKGKLVLLDIKGIYENPSWKF